MSSLPNLSRTDRHGFQVHLVLYFLATTAILLLVFEHSQLAARLGGYSTDLEEILVQQSVLSLLLGLLIVTYEWIENRWAYGFSAILFAGYAGTRLAAAFSQTLGLVPALENQGVPISDYQRTFYLLALAAAVCYLLSILLLRRSYGRLIMKHSNKSVVA